MVKKIVNSIRDGITLVAGCLFAHSFALAKAQGIASVRIDTHEGNTPMQHAIAKSGFSFCGVIHLVGGVDDGEPRIAFDKTI